MRITGGEKRGMVIRVPKKYGVRPPTEMIREGVFNTLRSVEGDRILDLFSGSGSFSFEALSRGAEDSVCIDYDSEAVRYLRENALRLGYEERIEVFNSDVLSALKRNIKRGKKFSLVFIDPPFEYPEKNILKILEMLPKVVISRARVVVRTSIHKKLAIILPFDITSIKRYGDSQVFFIVKV